MEYKPWRKMTPEEKEHIRWERRGRPRVVWHSQQQGTYVKALYGEIGMKGEKK